MPLPFDAPAASAALRAPEVAVHLDLGSGDESATAWGCDLSPEYVRFNAEYTT
jgi:N-acetylglutamate synthase/N-acetylornithine aminotransferase